VGLARLSRHPFSCPRCRCCRCCRSIDQQRFLRTDTRHCSQQSRAPDTCRRRKKNRNAFNRAGSCAIAAGRGADTCQGVPQQSARAVAGAYTAVCVYVCQRILRSVYMCPTECSSCCRRASLSTPVYCCLCICVSSYCYILICCYMCVLILQERLSNPPR
jgi:hypothetical protein